MVKSVTRGLLLFFVLFFVGGLKAQALMNGSMPHRVLANPQMLIFKENEQPSAEQWPLVVSKLGKYTSQSEWRKYQEIPDDLGQIHYRIRQYYQGVPAFLSIGIVHTQKGKILSVNGDLVSESQFSGKKVLDEPSALKLALSYLPATKYYWEDAGQNEALQMATGNPDTTYFPTGKLIYMAQGLNLGGTHRLCYQFDVFASEPLAGMSIFVDAETGEILASNDLILHGDSKGTAVTKYSGTQKIITDSTSTTNFRLREMGRGAGIETYNLKKGTTYSGGVDFTDADNTWNNVNVSKDEVATDAHWGAEMTYDYFKNVHSRNSYDGNGAKILSYVHYSTNYNNAFWDGTRMTYGDGDGTMCTPLTALDVCGHEITHAVTTNTANLVYSYESGALNESFSDVFGQTVEIWARPTKFNWRIGEDITPSGNGIRSMVNPNLFSHPKYYKGVNWYAGAGDNGGVHTNSGVQNYWYYLIAKGSSGTNEKGSVFKIDSLGIDKAAKIAYRNLSVYLTSSSQYADARIFSVLSAADLYGQCSNEVIQVTNAWWVCGVGNKYDSAYVKANFAGDTLACKPGKAMNFLNYSENYKASQWYFGDGGTATTTNTSHAYTSYGKYTVKLVVDGCFKGKKDSMTKVQYVKVDSTFDICKAFLLPKTGTDSAVGCRGFVYDEGGEDNYITNQIVKFKLKLPGADSIRYRFKVLDYEVGFDSLVMYKNSVAGANRLGQFSGNTLPLAGAWKTIAGSALWFIQYSDPMVTGKGFKVEYEGVFKPLDVQLRRDTVVCKGRPVLLAAAAAGGRSTPYTYSWYGTGVSGGGKTQVVFPAATQQYTLVLWDGCALKSDTAIQTIYVKPPLTVKIVQADTAVCITDTMFLAAKVSGGDTAGYKYQWSNGMGTSPLTSIILTDTIKVYLTLTDGCTVVSATDSARLDTYLPLMMSVSNDTTLCKGRTAILLVSIKGGNRLHGGGAYTLAWSNGVKAGAITVGPSVSTTYYVTGSEGCSPDVRDSVKVVMRNPLYLSTVKDSILCHGEKMAVNILDSGGLASNRKIVWDSIGLVGNSVVVNPLAVGKTIYRVHVEDGCTVLNDTTIFTVDRLPAITGSISLSDSILCFGDFTIAQITAGGGRSLTRKWFLDGVQISAMGVLDTPLLSKTYRLVVSDGCSVPYNDSVKVIVAPSKISLSLGARDSVICAGSSVGYLSVNGTGGFAPLTYKWDDPMKQTTAKATGLGKGIYMLRVRDAEGCLDSLGLFINEYRLLMNPLKDTVIARGTLAKLYGYNGSNWRWSPKKFMVSTDTLETVFVRPTDSMVYTLLALDSNGCLFRDTVWVRVVDPELVRIPNLITPNGDFDNEYWDLTELFEYNQRLVNIYNRAGELVYHSDPYQNDWNGKDASGADLPVGIYFYHMKHNKTREEHRGFIQIMR